MIQQCLLLLYLMLSVEEKTAAKQQKSWNLWEENDDNVGTI